LELHTLTLVAHSYALLVEVSLVVVFTPLVGILTHIWINSQTFFAVKSSF